MDKVSVVALQNKNFPNLYLHLLRRQDGTWSLPGGHAISGETPLETAKRELKEEAGITNIDLRYVMDESFGDTHVFLFIGEHTERHETLDNDPDKEGLTTKFLDPFEVRKPHIPEQRNILLKYLQQEQDITEVSHHDQEVIENAVHRWE